MRIPGLLLLEITARCQLACVHCYAESGPRGTPGAMTPAVWERVIDEAAGLGVPRVQFTGGEPTTHPDLPRLVERALSHRVEVEIYTNLVRVTPAMWAVFGQPGVRIGTSYYSDAPAEHQAITGRRGGHARTTAGIRAAVERGIPIRVGLIDVHDGQRVDAAKAMLAGLGVRDISVDRVRRLGRARVFAAGRPDIGQLCGACAGDLLAVLPDGSVTPCPMARWISVGNVRRQGLGSILAGRRLRECRAVLRRAGALSVRTDSPCAPP